MQLAVFRFPFSVFLLLLIATPTLVEAKTTTWEFRNQARVDGWTQNNLQIQLMPAGLKITAPQTGQMYKGGGVGHASDEMRITFSSPTGVNGVFFWHMPHQPSKEAYQIPLVLPQSAETQELVLDLSKIPEWSPKADSVGIVVDAGATLLLQKIEFRGPSVMDRIVYPLQSFWKFDALHAYTINFLWGPLRVYSPESIANMYQEIPPLGDSWNSILYVLIILSFIVAVIRKNMAIACIIVCSLWIVYDIRMGAELIGFARHDITHWWSKPIEIRTYRDRGSFPVFAELAAEYTQNQEDYVLISSHNWPYLGYLRYHTYPSLPIYLEDDTDTDPLQTKKTWLIYNRPDITLTEDNALAIDDVVISPSGRIVLPYENDSFIFQTDS